MNFLYLRLKRRVAEIEELIEDMDEEIEALKQEVRDLKSFKALVVSQ